MGFRNPFRIHVDQKTGWVLMGDYGPDAGSTDPNRGPQGSVEYNVVKQPGFYGWPYCVRENVPYHDITYTANNGAGTDNGLYNCNAPVNDSPNNTGLTNLPPAIPATMWMGYSELDVRFPDLGGGGAPTGGARYYFDEDNPSETKFPKFYDGQWFIGEWNNDWIKTTTLNNQGLATGVACFAICQGYISPMDVEFGPDGSMYVVEWGQGFNENNPDSGVYRVDYIQGARSPIAVANVDNDAVPVNTTVNFSSAGSNDPDGTPLTYLWDFDDGTPTSTAPNPSHTFTAAGTYDVTLTVTDESGDSAVDTVRVVVGNQRPVVTIEIPENGKIADFGDKIPYKISVVDPDGGSTGAGTIPCNAHPDRVQARPRHARARAVQRDRLRGRVHAHRRRRPRCRREHLHGHHGQLHGRGQRPGGAGHRQRRGDPAAQAQAGRVLRDHRPHRGRPRHRRPGRRDRGDDRRRRRPVGGLHRGRRLDLVQPVQPRGPEQGHVPRGLRRRGRHDPAALRRGRRPARGRDAEHRADRRLADVA